MRIVHNLSSAAGNVGASQLQRLAQGVEGMLPGDEKALTDRLSDLERLHEVTLSAVAAALSASPVPAPLGGAPAMEASALLERARGLIRDHDTASVECVHSLRACLKDHAEARGPLTQLEASIEAYDFERAVLELEMLTQLVGSSRDEDESRIEGA
jgi:hypothetical protein